MKQVAAKNTLIEKTAIELAVAVYDQYRRDGYYDDRYPNERKYAKKHFEKYIPKAVELLTKMLSLPGTTEEMKQEIYEALIERADFKPVVNGNEVDVSKYLQ